MLSELLLGKIGGNTSGDEFVLSVVAVLTTSSLVHDASSFSGWKSSPLGRMDIVRDFAS